MLIVSGIPDSSEPRISDFTATICWIPDFTSTNFPDSRNPDSLARAELKFRSDFPVHHPDHS